MVIFNINVFIKLKLIKKKVIIYQRKNNIFIKFYIFYLKYDKKLQKFSKQRRLFKIINLFKKI